MENQPQWNDSEIGNGSTLDIGLLTITVFSEREVLYISLSSTTVCQLANVQELEAAKTQAIDWALSELSKAVGQLEKFQTDIIEKRAEHVRKEWQAGTIGA